MQRDGALVHATVHAQPSAAAQGNQDSLDRHPYCHGTGKPVGSAHNKGCMPALSSVHRQAWADLAPSLEEGVTQEEEERDVEDAHQQGAKQNERGMEGAGETERKREEHDKQHAAEIEACRIQIEAERRVHQEQRASAWKHRQAQCQALEQERDQLKQRIQELDARLADASRQLSSAEEGHKGAQVQARLLQSKLAMLEQDLSHDHGYVDLGAR